MPRDAASEAWVAIMDLLFSEHPPRIPAIAAEFGLSPMGLKLFRFLEPGEESPMSALAERIYCDASNLTGVVDRLESRGLVERRDAPGDRRVKLIALTDEGVATRERIAERLAVAPPALAALPGEDQRALRDILMRALTPASG